MSQDKIIQDKARHIYMDDNNRYDNAKQRQDDVMRERGY